MKKGLKEEEKVTGGGKVGKGSAEEGRWWRKARKRRRVIQRGERLPKGYAKVGEVAV